MVKVPLKEQEAATLRARRRPRGVLPRLHRKRATSQSLRDSGVEGRGGRKTKTTKQQPKRPGRHREGKVLPPWSKSLNLKQKMRCRVMSSQRVQRRFQRAQAQHLWDRKKCFWLPWWLLLQLLSDFFYSRHLQVLGIGYVGLPLQCTDLTPYRTGQTQYAGKLHGGRRHRQKRLLLIMFVAPIGSELCSSGPSRIPHTVVFTLSRLALQEISKRLFTQKKLRHARFFADRIEFSSEDSHVATKSVKAPWLLQQKDEGTVKAALNSVALLTHLLVKLMDCDASFRSIRSTLGFSRNETMRRID